MNHIVDEPAPLRVQFLFAVLLLAGLVSVLVHWGGYQSTFAAAGTSFVLAVVYLISWLLSYCFRGGKITVAEFVFFPWLVYLTFSALAVSVAPWDAWVTIVSQSSGVLFYCVAYRYIRALRVQWLLLGGVLVLGVACSLVAYYQAYFDYDWGPFGVYRLAQYGDRMAGFFGQPNAYAAFLMLAMPIPLFYVFSRPSLFWVKVAGILLFLVMQWGMLLSISRGAMVTMVVVYFLYAYLLGSNWRWRSIALSLLLLTGGLQYVGFSMSQDTAGARVGALVESKGESARSVYFPIAFKLFKDSPVTGVGEASFRYKWDSVGPVSHMVEESHVHSDHLELLAESGVIGVLCYYVPVVGLLLYGCLALRRVESSERKVILKIAIVGLSGFLVHGCVDFLTKYQTILYVVFFYLALIAQQHVFARPLHNTRFGKVILGVVSLFTISILFFSYGPVQAKRLRERNRDIQERVNKDLENRQFKSLADLDEVLENCDRALKYDPRYVPALLQGIEVFSTKARFDSVNRGAYLEQALYLNDAILELNGEMWRGWAKKAELLDKIGGRDLEVLANYKIAMEIAPQNLLLRMNYITYLKRKGIVGRVYEEQAEFVRETFPGNKALKDL